MFNLNHIKDKQLYFIEINLFVLRIESSIRINLQNSGLRF
jgi:hypothetical protein